MSSESSRRSDDQISQEIAALAVAVLASKNALDEARDSFSTRDQTRKDIASVKKEVGRARRRTVVGVVTSVFLAMIGAFLLNNYAVTHCFFVSPPRQDAMCNIMFRDYNDQVSERLERLRETARISEENARRIEELERRTGVR